jgi:hypothetical protein
MFPGSYFNASYFAPGYWSGTGEVEIALAASIYHFFTRRKGRRF